MERKRTRTPGAERRKAGGETCEQRHSMIERGSRERKPDGFVIVAVLWILGALATLASIYAVYIIDTATAGRVQDDRVQAEAVISAGLELTAMQVTAKPGGIRPDNGGFDFRMGNCFA